MEELEAVATEVGVGCSRLYAWRGDLAAVRGRGKKASAESFLLKTNRHPIESFLLKTTLLPPVGDQSSAQGRNTVMSAFSVAVGGEERCDCWGRRTVCSFFDLYSLAFFFNFYFLDEWHDDQYRKRGAHI